MREEAGAGKAELRHSHGLLSRQTWLEAGREDGPGERWLVMPAILTGKRLSKAKDSLPWTENRWWAAHLSAAASTQEVRTERAEGASRLSFAKSIFCSSSRRL